MNSVQPPLYLSCPGVVSALGSGMASTVTALLTGGPSPLIQSDSWIVGRSIPVGAVQEALRPFDSDLDVQYRSRTNQLLWHAMADVEPVLMATRQRFGAARVGVVLGTSTTGVDENLAAFRHVAQGGSWSDSGFQQTQMELSSPVDFVQAQYRLSGMGYVISTACTSGARALASAARLLRQGLCDAVLCGGVDCLSRLTINGFGALGLLSDTLARPFSAQRQGINIGEAAAVFVMTREPWPVREAGAGEHITLLGYGASSDAWHMSSPHPKGTGAVAAMTAALRAAGLSADALGWLNLHGTGTQQNDAVEAMAVVQALGEHVSASSTKSYTGHTLGAAGALEAAIVWGVVSRRLNPEGLLPAQPLPEHDTVGAHSETAVPAAGLDLSGLAPLRLTSAGDHWPVAEGRRIAMSTSFAFGGNNIALLIGEHV